MGDPSLHGGGLDDNAAHKTGKVAPIAAFNLTGLVILSKFPFGFSAMNSYRAVLESTLRCPACGFEKQEEMPVDFCLLSYTCQRCGTVLHPKQGDCCVFCSFGSRPCPPLQAMKE
jgi:rubredoxin